MPWKYNYYQIWRSAKLKTRLKTEYTLLHPHLPPSSPSSYSTFFLLGTRHPYRISASLSACFVWFKLSFLKTRCQTPQGKPKIQALWSEVCWLGPRTSGRNSRNRVDHRSKQWCIWGGTTVPFQHNSACAGGSCLERRSRHRSSMILLVGRDSALNYNAQTQSSVCVCVCLCICMQVCGGEGGEADGWGGGRLQGWAWCLYSVVSLGGNKVGAYTAQHFPMTVPAPGASTHAVLITMFPAF